MEDGLRVPDHSAIKGIWEYAAARRGLPREAGRGRDRWTARRGVVQHGSRLEMLICAHRFYPRICDSRGPSWSSWTTGPLDHWTTGPGRLYRGELPCIHIDGGTHVDLPAVRLLRGLVPVHSDGPPLPRRYGPPDRTERAGPVEHRRVEGFSSVVILHHIRYLPG